jgi:Aminopeptidase P, N-terminal domain.
MDNAIYKSRRINLSQTLRKNSVLLIPGANTQYRNADSAYAFRQDSKFDYLSGFCEPDSLMAIINNDDGINSVIFVPPKDRLKEIWDGHRAGPIGAVKRIFI